MLNRETRDLVLPAESQNRLRGSGSQSLPEAHTCETLRGLRPEPTRALSGLSGCLSKECGSPS